MSSQLLCGAAIYTRAGTVCKCRSDIGKDVASTRMPAVSTFLCHAQAMQQAKAVPAEERSEADKAFCSMILRQDNPARGLEEKWADLVSHMHSTETGQFRCGSDHSRQPTVAA